MSFCFSQQCRRNFRSTFKHLCKEGSYCSVNYSSRLWKQCCQARFSSSTTLPLGTYKSPLDASSKTLLDQLEVNEEQKNTTLEKTRKSANFLFVNQPKPPNIAELIFVLDSRCEKTKTDSPNSLLSEKDLKEITSLSETLQNDLNEDKCNDILALQGNLLWDYKQWSRVCKLIAPILPTQINNDDAGDTAKLAHKIYSCRQLVRERLLFNKKASVYLKVLSTDRLVAFLFDENDLEDFQSFLNQFEVLESDENFKRKDLLLLIKRFYSVVNREAIFINLSPCMNKILTDFTINEKVTFLDELATMQCRSLTLLNSICHSLVSEDPTKLTRAKLRSICYSLGKLNYYHAPLLEKAVEDFQAELQSGSNSISPKMASSFLTICKKLKFKNAALVDAVATAMVPLLQRLVKKPSMPHQQEQDLKSFCEFISSLASLNVSLNKLQIVPGVLYPANEEPLDLFDIDELIKLCVEKHACSIEDIYFFKSLCILDLFDDSHFHHISPQIQHTFSNMLEQKPQSTAAISQYQKYCSHLILAHGCLKKLPSALKLWSELEKVMDDYVAVKQSEMTLNDAAHHIRQYFVKKTNDTSVVGLQCLLSHHIGLGYVADVIVLPKSLWEKVGKYIVAVCPSVSDSVNLFEELRGEKMLEINHLKKLNCIPFSLNPTHWSQLENTDEKMEYLNAKWNIELTDYVGI